MGHSTQKRTKYLVVSALLAALGVILLTLGSLLDVLDLSVAALASILCVYAVIEMGGAYPFMIWIVTSFLSLLLLPNKSPAVFYLFGGCYPIFKEKLERLPRRWLCFVLKLLVFHVALVLVFFTFRLFLSADAEEAFQPLLIAVVYGLSLACFLVYDYALTKLITFYLIRLRDRFRIR